MKLIPQLFLTRGDRFIERCYQRDPALKVKYVRAHPKIIFSLMQLQYRDLFWVGGSYRYQDGYAGMLGVNVNNVFNVRYAHDFTTTNLNNVSRGTHGNRSRIFLGNKSVVHAWATMIKESRSSGFKGVCENSTQLAD